MAYNDYLLSDHWQEVRVKKLKTVNGCQICGKNKNLNVHHKDYIYSKAIYSKGEIITTEIINVLSNEKLGDLLVLCGSCHRLWHYYIGNKRLRHKQIQKLKRLIKLGATPKMAFYVFANSPELYDIIYLQLKRKQADN